MSNRLTFSLASLILIFAMVVAPTAVMAAEGGPTVESIVLDTAATTTQARGATVFRITFSEAIAVDSFDATDTLTANLRDARSGQDGLLGAPVDTQAITAVTAVSPSGDAGSNRERASVFTFAIDTTGIHSGATNNTARQILLQVPEDAVSKRTFDGLGTPTDLGNVKSDIFTIDLPPVETATDVTITVEQKMDSNNDPVADTYTLTLTFVQATDSTVAADPTNGDPMLSDVVVMPDGAATPVDDTGVAVTDMTTVLSQAADNDGIFTHDYMINIGTEVTFGLLSSYIDAEPVSILDPVPATPTSEPDFRNQSIANIEIWINQEYDSRGADGDMFLPVADDVFGETLTYSFDPDLPAGLSARAIDNERRFIIGTPTAATDGATDYEYIVTNSSNGTDSIEFTINVKDPVAPDAPTMVMADEAARGILPPSPTANTVTVTWMAPSTMSEMDYGSAITGYTVSWEQVDMAGDPVASGVTGSAMVDANEDETMAMHTHTTGTLPIGIYQFEVQATNGAGTGDASDQTDGSTVIVANPPMTPADLRAAKSGNTVRLTWNTPLNGRDPNAPITGHVIYITDPDNEEETEESDATDTTEHLVEADLETGRYVFRVAAVNLDGESDRSIGTAFEVDLTIADTMSPDFGDETIDNIVATVDVAIPVALLPEATDSDTAAADLTYSISNLPDGLMFDEDDLSITGTPTTKMDETVFRYMVEDPEGNSDSIRFTITVNAATPSPPVTSTTMLDANGFIVYVRDADNPPNFGTSNPKIAEWADMPNLWELFSEGGGGSLQLTVNKADGTNVGARQVVFSEIMWAVDEGKIGQDSYDGNQWIELRNRTATAIPISDISFAVKADGRPALAQSTDLVSNVVGGGADWIGGKGQNGNSTAGSLKEFISMYRKRYHNDSAGWNAGEWLKSDQVYHPNYKGTPGKAQPQGPKTFTTSGVALGTVFNEISNSSNPSHEWIELRKREGELSNLEKWVVHMVTGADDRDVATNPTQEKLFQLPKLNDGRYGDILLITKTDPARDDDHPLRGGYNVEKSDADQDGEGRDKNIRYYVADDWTKDLPDDGKFVLILRHGNDKTNHEKIQDIAGYHPNLKVERADFFSNLWPLINYPAPNRDNNAIKSGSVQRRQFDDIPGTKTKDKNQNDKTALRDDDNGWTSIGYKRNADASAKNGGTPGYPNGAQLSNETQAGADPVIISEIMYATGARNNIPQWIELRNTSDSRGVNLDGWRVTIVNHDQDDADGTTYSGDLSKSYNINGKIPPGQTFLIVAHSGTDNTKLPSERIQAIRSKRGDRILSQYGFEITVENKEKDGSREMADMVGNLGAAEGRRSKSFADTTWDLPAGTNEDGDRVSITRVMGSDGMDAASWNNSGGNSRESTYYGNRSDIASPGYVDGGVLPVSLSKFRPERLDDGSVAVRWVTESELDNAGFNILRGEALDAEFTKLNTKLIAGQGTTSERTVYEFVDTTAKPNVVYYYQIQDVSIDGEVQTLRTTHLRGNVSAAGKAATTWGELKALQ